MSVFVAIDKRKPEYTPVESTFPKFVLCFNLTGGVCKCWGYRVVFTTWMRTVRIVYIGGACHDKASLGSVILDSGDEIASPFEINCPYFIFVGRTECRSKVNNCGYAFNGSR